MSRVSAAIGSYKLPCRERLSHTAREGLTKWGVAVDGAWSTNSTVLLFPALVHTRLCNATNLELQ